MKLLKIGDRTYNLDQLVWYDVKRTRKLREDYRRKYNPLNQLIEPTDADHRDVVTVEVCFVGIDKPVKFDEEASAAFLAALDQGAEPPQG
jgi:hypothetical protein